MLAPCRSQSLRCERAIFSCASRMESTHLRLSHRQQKLLRHARDPSQWLNSPASCLGIFHQSQCVWPLIILAAGKAYAGCAFVFLVKIPDDAKGVIQQTGGHVEKASSLKSDDNFKFFFTVLQHSFLSNMYALAGWTLMVTGSQSFTLPIVYKWRCTISPASVRISWARLLKRVFDIDIEQCPHCGGTLKIIAAILESSAITKILDHLGLPVRALPRTPAQIHDLFEPTWSRVRSFQSSSSLGWPLPLGVFRLKRQNAAKSLTFLC